MREVIRILGMSCRDYAAVTSRELDEPLPRGLRAAHRLHVLYCRDCARFRKQLRTLRDAVARMDEVGAQAGSMPSEIRERLIRRLETESEKK